MDEEREVGRGEMIDAYYAIYQQNPEQLDPSWRHFFQGMEFALAQPQGATSTLPSGAPSDCNLRHLIRHYRVFGHLQAHFDIIHPREKKQIPQLDFKNLGFTEEDLEKSFPTFGVLSQEEAPLREIIAALEGTYCNGIGFEYMGFHSKELESFIQERIEPAKGGMRSLSLDQKKLILHNLNRAELFEIFLHTKYVGQKRFSLEGGELLIPMCAAIIEESGRLGVEELAIGMAHRGRLNVLANVLNKEFTHIFHEFEDTLEEASFEGSGDVKYHKGFSSDVMSIEGKKIHLSLAANPSHLESVDPVLEGQVRAKQVLRKDVTKQRVLPLVIHGDASLAGQGVVYETLQLLALPAYSVGGTIHLVINNQIGFTTLPSDGRSTRYCTDIARPFGAPVFHVNGEDPEACFFAALLATSLRQHFGCDVFLDLNCYRKYGHNEADEPAFTQPLEYQMIRRKPGVRVIYRDELIRQGVVEREIAEALEAEFRASLQEELELVKSLKTESPRDTATEEWKEIREANRKDRQEPFRPIQTAVEGDHLIQLTRRFCTLPSHITPHRKMAKLLEDRIKMIEADPEEPSINWGLAEHLAFATLLWEGHDVRLTGQDSCRGTFNHRHGMIVDQKEGEKYRPLSHLREGQGRFDLYNSPLSEYAVLGFEFGYSLCAPQALVCWEAQYGDFSNGAQIIMDQYLATSEQKWDRMSGLVLLLPHGYEGQGPEHSSSRIERFLQLCGDQNMTVCNPTTPAQLFHLLRRQVIRESRRPLVLLTPKQILGDRRCVSPRKELERGHFYEILQDPTPPGQPKRVACCSGRIYYDLIAEREKRGSSQVAIVRVEQLYPLHFEGLREILSPYHGFQQLLWVQEEPENMGGWDYMRPLLRQILPDGMEAHFVGRPRSASPATGSAKKHKAQQAAILDAVFNEEE